MSAMTRWMVFLLAIISLTVNSETAYGDGYNIVGEVRDWDFPTEPRFSAPLITFTLASQSFDRYFGSSNQVATPDRGAFVFDKYLGDFRITNNWAIVEVQAGGGDFILADPSDGRVLLTPEYSGDPIPLALNLRHRSNVAEGYRRAVLDALRNPNLSLEILEGVNTDALKAVAIDPKLDNFLLVTRVTSATTRRGIHDVDGAILSIEDLNALDGFSNLTIDDRWRVQSSLLDALVLSDEAREEALQAGKDMLASLPVDDPAALERLKIVRVFMTVSDLYATNGDCLSLARNAERAVELAPAIRMDWTSKRAVMLEWGDCVEKLSGVGDGRTTDQFLADAATSDALSSLWKSFAEAGDDAYGGIAFSTLDKDVRLRRLIETAQAIRDRS